MPLTSLQPSILTDEEKLKHSPKPLESPTKPLTPIKPESLNPFEQSGAAMFGISRRVSRMTPFLVSAPNRSLNLSDRVLGIVDYDTPRNCTMCSLTHNTDLEIAIGDMEALGHSTATLFSNQ